MTIATNQMNDPDDDEKLDRLDERAIIDMRRITDCVYKNVAMLADLEKDRTRLLALIKKDQQIFGQLEEAKKNAEFYAAAAAGLLLLAAKNKKKRLLKLLWREYTSPASLPAVFDVEMKKRLLFIFDAMLILLQVALAKKMCAGFAGSDGGDSAFVFSCLPDLRPAAPAAPAPRQSYLAADDDDDEEEGEGM